LASVDQAVGWAPYRGVGAVLLALTLFAVVALLVFLGRRRIRALPLGRVGKLNGVFLFTIWLLSLAVLLLLVTLVRELPPRRPQVPSPITPVTIACGIASFIMIAYLSRASGLKVALASAFVGTAAAPMIFELPFDLIVIGRSCAPVYVALLFFMPLFLVEISTLSLLQLSPLTGVSKYTAYSLAGMFAVFGVWALFGFAYPADPISFSLNSISKVLSFTTAITLFVRTREGNKSRVPVEGRSQA
jgi:hypothetical protein